jgi:hypothetical protein
MNEVKDKLEAFRALTGFNKVEFEEKFTAFELGRVNIAHQEGVNDDHDGCAVHTLPSLQKF